MVIAKRVVDLGQREVGIDLLLDLLRRVTVFGPASDKPDGNASPLEDGLAPADSFHSHNMRMLRLQDCHSAKSVVWKEAIFKCGSRIFLRLFCPAVILVTDALVDSRTASCCENADKAFSIKQLQVNLPFELRL